MKYDCAPMEGITSALFRRVHHQYFPGVHQYYTPFLSPSRDHVFTKRDKREILPAYNRDIPVVPQLLTRVAGDFLWAANALADLGYRSVNLNLGCPSGTVTAKGKGSGFLADPDALDAFLEEIFSRCPIPISVKTRLGVRDPAEFEGLLDIYNRYPIAQLILHPRVRQDFYRLPARREAFAALYPRIAAPVCYNGDLFTHRDCRAFAQAFPQVDHVMVGRGLMADPALIQRCQGKGGADRARLRAFHDDLYEGYCQAFGSRRSAMLRMKETWFFHIHLFRDSQRHGKALRKARDAVEYEYWVNAIFGDLDLLEEAVPRWQEG